MKQVHGLERLQPGNTASASFPFSIGFLPAAIEFTDKAARGFGFGEAETAGLVLAVEEIFSFYLKQLAAGECIGLLLETDVYQLRLTMSFQAPGADLTAFNLTYRADPNDEASLAGLGPMIAARSVTRLNLDFGDDGRVRVQLTREKDYAPAVPLEPPARGKPAGPAALHTPLPEDIMHFAALLASDANAAVPAFLNRPGMAADMLASGAIGALLASAGGFVLGGVIWRRLNDSTVVLSGPYVFYDDAREEVFAELLDAAIAEVSRSGARTLLRRQGPLPGFERFFDFLGELKLKRPKGTARGDVVWTHYYKQLREETSGVVYAAPRFAGFLRAEYGRLCLPRQVRETSPGESGRPGASLLSVEFEHRRSLATLRPLAAGGDMAENLAAHLALLKRQGILNVIAELDTGRPGDTAFAPALYASGFSPRLAVPDAGIGDLVIFAR
jgi:hypothetical protein